MACFCLSLMISRLRSTASELISSDINLKAMELNPMHYPPMECYNSQLNIQKHTLATTDSYRDTEMIQLIFPEAMLEYIPHFHQDECARASKLYLPYTCFKLHAPQTWQLKEGYLSIKTLEREYTKKFYSVINGYSKYNFDAFFDNNIAFWVKYLDKYLQQINDNHHILTSYIGLKWYHKSVEKMFYSLIIQSPDSQRIFEFISFNKPDLSLYTNIRQDFKWKETSIIRASFKQYPENEYPWTGYVGTIYKLGSPILPDIVPIRISYSVSNLNKQITFYSEILDAILLQHKTDVMDILDVDISVSYAFMQPIGSVIEMQFIEKPSYYTYGAFTIDMYSNLLMATHLDVISDAYCGIDRWFDNHYGYDTSMFYNDDSQYMDRVFFNNIQNNYKYRIYYIGHQRDEAYVDSDSFDIEQEDLYGLKYKLYVFDPNGQTIQMIGYFVDTFIDKQAPTYNKQWCETKCPNNEAMGALDEMKIKNGYVEDVNDIVYQIVFGDQLLQHSNENKSKFNTLLITIICVICLILLGLVIYCACAYYCKVNSNIHGGSDVNTIHAQETQCLLPK